MFCSRKSFASIRVYNLVVQRDVAFNGGNHLITAINCRRENYSRQVEDLISTITAEVTCSRPPIKQIDEHVRWHALGRILRLLVSFLGLPVYNRERQAPT